MDRDQDFIHAYTVVAMDNKLRELMTPDEYAEWSTKTAKEAFKAWIDSLDNGEFKDFCKDNYKMIIGEEDDRYE